jgi:hypothetical protein
MSLNSKGLMERLMLPFLLPLSVLGGCGSAREEQASAADLGRPIDALHSLAAADPELGARLELDPAIKGTWWTSRGRWDDPSRRIAIDWGPLALVLYPTTLLQLPAALLEMPASVLDSLLKPQDRATKEQIRRLADEAAERHYPSNETAPR